MTLELNIFNLVKQPLDMDYLHDETTCFVDSLVEEHVDFICIKDFLEPCLF